MKKKKDILALGSKCKDKAKITAYVEGWLLSDFKKYGDISSTVNTAVKTYTQNRYRFELRELLLTLQKNIASLETWKEYGPIGDEGTIGSYHLRMLELYKHLYYSIQESNLLRKPVQYKPGSLIKTKSEVK